MTTTEDSLELRVATVGRAFPGVECKVVDPETGKTLGPGEVGEFCARGYNIMKGYYKMPGGHPSGHRRGRLAPQRRPRHRRRKTATKVTGRIKDMIIRGGENIYPQELEEFLYTNPKVKDVQVIGVPSKVYGEEVMACIVLKEGETMTEEEVKEFCMSRIAKA